MPNEYGQVTSEDFKAPAGKFRIMKEDMRDGALSIVTDINHVDCAKEIILWLRRDDLDDDFIFTLCDDRGEAVDVPVPEDSETDEQFDTENGSPPWE